jgi:hypothetical protein
VWKSRRRKQSEEALNRITIYLNYSSISTIYSNYSSPVLQNLDVWKSRRRKQSEEALTRISEVRRIEQDELEHGMGKRKV